MPELRPVRGVHYNPAAVDVNTVLAPPYDVIDDAQREALYARGDHNIVRIDAGRQLDTDIPGGEDRYTRARTLLDQWIADGVLVRDPSPAFYVADHRFSLPEGGIGRRRGLFATVAAAGWDAAPIRPHERTLRGPKADRLALMRATAMNTSAVFGVWSGAGCLSEILDQVITGRPAIEGHIPGEQGDEFLRLWIVDDQHRVEAIRAAGADATLYIADGHHRYETAAAYAEERRALDPSASAEAGFGFTLAYLCAADDPALQLWPTHRMIRPRAGVPSSVEGVIAAVEERFAVRSAGNVNQAIVDAAALRDRHHAFTLVVPDGVLVIHRERDLAAGTPPRDRLDVSVLERDLLQPWGIGSEELSGGALLYDHSSQAIQDAVSDGTAAVGILLNGSGVAEMLAVADARDTMPQKSTYFYPKVPSGLVMSPL